MAAKSTSLGSLRPEDKLEPSMTAYKTESRPFGSYVFPFPKPHRVPDGGRLYYPGDPLKYLDWKAFARTDQAIIRQKREEVSSKVLIGIDMSKTMCWPSTELLEESLEVLPQKLEVAIRIALHLAFNHLKVGDQVTFVLIKESSSLPSLPILTIRSSLDVVNIYYNLLKHKFDAKHFEDLFDIRTRSKRRGDIAYWIGDLLDNDVSEDFYSSARYRVLLQTLSSREINIDWIDEKKSYRELDEAKEFLGAQLLSDDNYMNALNQWFEQIEEQSRSRFSQYFMVSDNTPINMYLKYLSYLGLY